MKEGLVASGNVPARAGFHIDQQHEQMPGLVENSIGMVNPLQGLVQVEGSPQQQSSKGCRGHHGNHDHAVKQRFEFQVFHRIQSLLPGGLTEQISCMTRRQSNLVRWARCNH